MIVSLTTVLSQIGPPPMRCLAISLLVSVLLATASAINPYEETETNNIYVRWNDDYGRPEDCADFFTKLRCTLTHVTDLDDDWSVYKASSIEEANKWMRAIIDVLASDGDSDGGKDEENEYEDEAYYGKNEEDKGEYKDENHYDKEGKEDNYHGEYEGKEYYDAKLMGQEKYTKDYKPKYKKDKYSKYEDESYTEEGKEGYESYGNSYDPMDDPYKRSVIADAITQVRGELVYRTIAAQPAAVPTECKEALPNACPKEGLYGLNLIRAPAVWNALPGTVTDAPLEAVMVIDTGVLSTHADLAGNLGDGLSTQLLGGVESPVRDDNGHGTHVAGTVFARWNNGADSAVGVVGNAIGGVCGCGTDAAGTLNTVCLISCINRATERGVMVINLSWGRGGITTALPPGDPERAAIERFCESGGIVVAAAGNDRQDVSQTQPVNSFTYPAKFAQDLAATHPKCVVAVAAVDKDGVMAAFSNFGAAVKIAAPGVDIKSAGIASDTAVAELSGTSMAAPHVTGMATLLVNAFPGVSRGRVYDCVINTAAKRPVKPNPENPGAVNGGIADLQAAYECLLAAPPCPVHHLPPCVNAHSGVAVDRCDTTRYCRALKNNTERVCQYDFLPDGHMCHSNHKHGAHVMFEPVTSSELEASADKPTVELMGYSRRKTSKSTSGNHTDTAKPDKDGTHQHSHDYATINKHRKTPYSNTHKYKQAERQRHRNKHQHRNKNKVKNDKDIKHCGICKAGRCIEEASYMCKKSYSL